MGSTLSLANSRGVRFSNFNNLVQLYALHSSPHLNKILLCRRMANRILSGAASG
jgi:hypothetical protein